MDYSFLVDTYSSERLKTLNVWSMFGDDDYGPSVDTGGLPVNDAVTIHAYPDIPSLIAGESRGGSRAPLPGPGQRPSTERPDR